MTDKVTDKVTDKTPNKLLRLIVANPSITLERMKDALSMSQSGVRKVLNKLREQGVIRRVGSDKTGHWEIIE
jgi:ATP-dependent DNA helicase RecG